MANIASIQAQQAENERQLAVDTQRARLQAVQTYIESVAKLEADNADKKSLANTLERRETKLTSELGVAQAAKDATAIADITAKLEAVKTAEARTAKAIKAGDKDSELAALKAQLEAQKAAIGSADSATTAANKKELALRKAQLPGVPRRPAAGQRAVLGADGQGHHGRSEGGHGSRWGDDQGVRRWAGGR